MSHRATCRSNVIGWNLRAKAAARVLRCHDERHVMDRSVGRLCDNQEKNE